jgi:hypothetical protein
MPNQPDVRGVPSSTQDRPIYKSTSLVGGGTAPLSQPSICTQPVVVSTFKTSNRRHYFNQAQSVIVFIRAQLSIIVYRPEESSEHNQSGDHSVKILRLKGVIERTGLARSTELW